MSVFVHVVTHQQVCRHMDTCTPIERRKRLHAYVHAWLRLCLQLPEHQELVIAHSPTGKPYLRDFPHWQFNLSHSKQHLALVCGQTQHPLGIDIESHPRTIRPAVIKASLSATELSHYHQAAEPLRYWLQVWTLKEAVLKAHGKGLSFGLEKLVFADSNVGLQLIACDEALGEPQDWTLHEWIPKPGYRAALAWRPLK